MSKLICFPETIVKILKILEAFPVPIILWDQINFSEWNPEVKFLPQIKIWLTNQLFQINLLILILAVGINTLTNDLKLAKYLR